MSDKQLEEGKKRLAKDAFARLLGIELTEIRPGYASATLKVTPDLLNGEGLTHGGAIFGLADLVFAAASNSHGNLALALNVNISFLKATRGGAVLTAGGIKAAYTIVRRWSVPLSPAEILSRIKGLINAKQY